MEENKELSPKILRREVFTVKNPKRIVIGDPYYYRNDAQRESKATGGSIQTARVF